MSSDQSFKNRKPAMGKAEPGTIKRIFSYKIGRASCRERVCLYV